MLSAVELSRASHESLRGIAYENTTAAEPSNSITIATKSLPHKALNRLKRPRTSKQFPSPKTRSKLHNDARRDSGLAPSSSSSLRDSRTTMATDIDSSPSIRQSASLPSFRAQKEQLPATPPNQESSRDSIMKTGSHSDPLPQVPFMGILTEIPTGSFEDLTQPGQVDFSKRGSMLLGGKKAVAKKEGISNGHVVGSRKYQHTLAASPAASVPPRIISADEEALSARVRSMYEDKGNVDHDQAHWPGNPTSNGHAEHKSCERGQPSIRIIENVDPWINARLTPNLTQQRGSTTTHSLNSLIRDPNELAGGIEDWEGIQNGDVDRYGFIVPHNLSSRASSTYSSTGHRSPEPPRLQRMSTLLQLASEAPRRSRSRLSNARTGQSPARSANSRSLPNPLADQQNARPNSSQSSYRSTSGQSSKLRLAANKLPHNKDRRCVDEAGDMLTLPPGLADIAEDEEDGNSRVIEIKARECDRDEKWRRMAKVVRNDKAVQGGGMVFEFDARNPKLIERTWKGIPDKWRATAWHAFLTASARKRKGCVSDEDLREAFRKLIYRASPDDVQIDIDVPRTINCHIMFRRRYRGGQRLLFRVLHCISVYFPETGYVQGMAALAATLLCYFDEEMAFVMMVRLWQLRGLELLYRSGFEGLMAALEEFEVEWLGKGEVASKLSDLNITATAYGTRWYLTLFNYSIPFPAQLRVWDVFMLLGDPDIPYSSPSSSTNGAPLSFHHGLDVLHACSAALVDGTREILLDSDFENAMKVLTSWIPVKDEEMMMRVARVEWKLKRRKGGGVKGR